MFCRNRISSTLINVLLFVYWCEISLVNCDDLKFWEPNPTDGRRVGEGNKYRNKIEIFEKSFRHKRGKSLNNKYHENSQNETHTFRSKIYYKSDPNEEHRFPVHEVEHYRSRTKYPRNKKRDRDNIDATEVSHVTNSKLVNNWLRTRSLTGGSSEESKRYKPKRFKQKGRRDSQPYESTRITPMYLMQASENKPKQKDEYYKLQLTPYVIAEQLKEISEKFPDVNVTQEIIGRTVEYNDIVLLKITSLQSTDGTFFRAKETKYNDEAQDKKIIFIVHGLSVMGMTKLPCLSTTEDFFILLSYYFAHLDKFDIFLIPMANPDGYMRSLQIWNKNMSPQNACPGVALDRNFEVAWNVTPDMSSCSQLYPGSSAFSEAESKAVRDVFHHYSHKIIAYFHVHSGTHDVITYKGEAILYPKGYTDIQTDEDKYIDLKGEVDEVMKNASFQVMSVTVDTLFNWYNTKILGTSVDYASTVYGIPYAMELVMQLYESDNAIPRERQFDRLALTELWKRLIDVLFNNIWKNTHTNNDNK